MAHHPWTWIAIGNNDQESVFELKLNENFKTTDPVEIEKIMRRAVSNAAEKLADDDSKKGEFLKLYDQTEDPTAT